MKDDEETKKPEKYSKMVLVKGYMRPDGTSYYVSIPREIRDSLSLKGGEYFVMRAKKGKKRITMKLVELAADEE
ncbi:MAG TPA: AbrB/MazE/SpoVT family DNA-binding domain-containing protein [Candidatus Bilamarchaeaceae archaeon]|nr:AbrB/MazE/SpoVT family DNA-binding domain-containing protein [Candidatus Bilamarchaeaceae archaeon]